MQQAARVVGVAADNGHHVDTTLLQSRDCLSGGMRGVAVS
jgi:hypothetical protein